MIREHYNGDVAVDLFFRWAKIYLFSLLILVVLCHPGVDKLGAVGNHLEM
jgi:hypothetical protein